ncbi:hypothetical protein CHUAL_012799 [Chamberlinius hualienensis]
METKCHPKIMTNYRWILLSSLLMLFVVMASNNSKVEGLAVQSNDILEGWDIGQKELEQVDDNVQLEDNDKIWWNQLPKKESRSPKPNRIRPKFNPGIIRIGLGKRTDRNGPQIQQLAGPHVLVDMRRFFNGLLHQMRNFDNTNSKSSEKISNDILPPEYKEEEKFIANSAGSQPSRLQALRFTTRSKGVKNTYDPSLLWTGLGR